MITSVVFQIRWTLNEIESLFLDDIDYRGLEYWYEHVKRNAQEIKEAIKGKK